MAETMKLPDGRVGDLGKCKSCNADIVWAHFGDCAQSREWSRKNAAKKEPQ